MPRLPRHRVPAATDSRPAPCAPGRLTRRFRAVWQYLRSGVRLYTHAMVGIPVAAEQEPAAGLRPEQHPSAAPGGLPQPGHPERLATDTPLSRDEQLWTVELAADFR